MNKKKIKTKRKKDIIIEYISFRQSFIGLLLYCHSKPFVKTTSTIDLYCFDYTNP